jgi:hypothetical protein
MERGSQFNLAKILEETTNKLKETHPEAQEYLLELSKEELQARLTPSQALKIAETLLEKVGFKADSK